MGPDKCWRRELAAQVAAVGRTLQRSAGLRCAMLYGGAERTGQARQSYLRPFVRLIFLSQQSHVCLSEGLLTLVLWP